MRTRSIRILTLVSALALVTSTALPQDNARYEELPNFHRVNERLFRGGQPRPGGFELLNRLGIKTVVNLRDNDEREVREQLDVEQAGLRYFNIPLGRLGPPEDEEIQQVLSIINNPENQPVFVHCAQGADRTGLVIAVYRISQDGWTSEQAKAEAKRYGLRPWQIRKKKFIRRYYRERSNQTELAHPR